MRHRGDRSRVWTLRGQPVQPECIAEPLRCDPAALVCRPSAFELPKLDERGAQVRTAADEPGGAQLLRDLDSLLQVLDPARVAAEDARVPSEGEALRFDLAQPERLRQRDRLRALLERAS